MVTNIGHANPDRVAGLQCDPDEKAEERNDLDSAYDVWLAADDVVVMDHMAYGMGSSCLQVTFQARDIDESRRLFDTLVPMAPLMLALTAAAPIFKGQLVDTDVRWDVIAASVDDRTWCSSAKRENFDHIPQIHRVSLYHSLASLHTG
jgi:glutamate--cysteine ligase catalytic subunit